MPRHNKNLCLSDKASFVKLGPAAYSACSKGRAWRCWTRRFFAFLAALSIAWSAPAPAAHLHYGWQKVDGLNLFYREGGRADAPTILFLHGNPTSSIEYDELMQNLLDAEDIHVLALDYPSFGYSDAPDHLSYRYTFDHLSETVRHFLQAKGVSRYAHTCRTMAFRSGFD